MSVMLCAYCGARLNWPEDFPIRYEAICEPCLRPWQPKPSLWSRLRSWLTRGRNTTSASGEDGNKQ